MITKTSYPSYRQTDLPWLGQIPVHWKARKLKHVADVTFSSVDKHSNEDEKPVSLCNYVDVYKNEQITRELEFMQATASPEEIKRFTLKSDDVMITKDSELWNDIAIPAYVPNDMENVLCGYHLALIRPKRNEVDGKFLFRALQARPINYQFEAEATGITRYGIDQYAIGSTFFPVPPLPEQRAIAAYLDRATARIDALITKKQRLLDLLAEKRVALISQAVTKGLNFDMEMKDLGVAWLGQVPRHWERKKNKHVTNQLIDTEHKTAPFYPDGDYLVVRTSNIKNGKLILNDAKYTDREGYKEWTQRGKPEPGDILFTREAPAGEACIVPGNLKLCVGQRTVLFRINHEKVTSEYCLWSLYGGLASEFIQLLSQGSTVAHFNMSDIGNIPLLLPPLEEQKAISYYLAQKTEQLDNLIAKIETAIERLRDYRAALISSAVTGKIDVREN